MKCRSRNIYLGDKFKVRLSSPMAAYDLVRGDILTVLGRTDELDYLAINSRTGKTAGWNLHSTIWFERA